MNNIKYVTMLCALSLLSINNTQCRLSSGTFTCLGKMALYSASFAFGMSIDYASLKNAPMPETLDEAQIRFLAQLKARKEALEEFLAEKHDVKPSVAIVTPLLGMCLALSSSVPVTPIIGFAVGMAYRDMLTPDATNTAPINDVHILPIVEKTMATVPVATDKQNGSSADHDTL